MSRAKKYPVSLLPCGITPKAHTLYVADAAGNAREATREEVIAASMALSLRSMKNAPMMSASAHTKQFLVARMRDLPHEVFAVMLLDNRHRLIEYKELFRGTVDGASVHPREVVREVFSAHACAAVIFAHNHPSGVAEASSADEMITKRLRDSLALIDVRVLDHFIIGAENTLSFAEKGLL